MHFITGGGHEKYDRIFITDISVNEEVANTIDKLFRRGFGFQLVDHHATALPLAERYPMWCEVRVEESNMYKNDKDSKLFLPHGEREKVLSSGTSLFYKFLRNKHLPKINRNETLKLFAEMVRRYDCWEWHNVYKDDHPKRLNDLLYLIGREKFIERFSNNPLPVFTDTELTLLDIEQHRINKYIWYKKKDVKFKWISVGKTEYHVAYVFAEQHSSLLGNAIAEEHGNAIDFVVLIDAGSNKVSLRGIHDDVRLGVDVARHFGGGGHDKASGFELADTLQEEIFDKIFNEEEI